MGEAASIAGRLRRPRARTVAARGTALAATLVAAGACQYDPHTAIYTTSEPRPADVAGAYVPDADSAALVAAAGHAGARTSIRLDADGTMTFTDLPDFCWEFMWDDPPGRPRRGGKLASGAGTWKVEPKQETWWKVAACIRTPGPWSKPGTPGGYCVEWVLADDGPPYRIFLTLGDPDDGHALVFERAAAGPR